MHRNARAANSSVTFRCRVCFDDDFARDDVSAPCRCDGSIRWICHSCLRRQRSTRQPHSQTRCLCCNTPFVFSRVSLLQHIHLFSEAVHAVIRFVLLRCTLRRLAILSSISMLWLAISVHMHSPTNDPLHDSLHLSTQSNGAMQLWQETDGVCHWMGDPCNRGHGWMITPHRVNTCWFSGAQSIHFHCDADGTSFRGRFVVHVERLVSDGFYDYRRRAGFTWLDLLQELYTVMYTVLWTYYNSMLWFSLFVILAGMFPSMYSGCPDFPMIVMWTCFSPPSAVFLMLLWYIAATRDVYRDMVKKWVTNSQPLDLKA